MLNLQRSCLPFLLLASSCASGPYPEAHRSDVVEDYHGTAVADPYRWLEDPDSDQTRAWIEDQNGLTRTHLESIEAREFIAKRVEELWTYEAIGVPTRHGDWYYSTYNDGSMSQAQIVRSRTPGGPRELVLDPGTFSEDGTVSLGGTSYSHSGRYLAYGKSDGGSDWRVWHVMDLETGEELPDMVDWSRFSTPSWAADDSGFYYSRYPETEDRLTAPALNQTVWFHRLGTDQADDILVHEDPENPQRGFGAIATKDGRWLLMYVREGTARKNRLWFKDLRDPDADWNRRFDAFDAQYMPVANQEGRFWIQTDLDAPLGRVISVDATSADSPIVEVVAQATSVLNSATYVGDRLFLTYLEDAITRVRMASPDGEDLGALELPMLGTAWGFRGEIGGEETFFGIGGYTSPTTAWRLPLDTMEASMVSRPNIPFASDDYETVQEFYTSKDGTRIPLFITRKKGTEMDGDRPTLLYGYGGFNVSMVPFFSSATAAWLDLGGVYAVACLRGGGEYGREWHQAGTLARKQNVFDDFIAAAEALIDMGYTRAGRLAIQGGSNGGLLVGACLNQRPDLFAAGLPAVGVMDMLRYHLFTIGAAWASDYGRSDDPDMFPHLLAYSPYHNVQEGGVYPAVLVTTGDHDDRVVPAHSYKYAAALQHAQGGDAPILIRIETRAGHGAGKSREQSILEIADRWAFLVEHLGMELDGDQ